MTHLLDYQHHSNGDVTEKVISLLIRGAPERSKELQNLIRSLGIQFEKTEGSGKFKISAFQNVVCIDNDSLEIMWLLSYAAWEAMREYGSIIEAGQVSQVTLTAESIEEALLLVPSQRSSLDCIEAVRNMVNGNNMTWPDWVPQTFSTPNGMEQDSIRELWAIAVTWSLLHETTHAELFKTEKRPDSLLKEERECDRKATCWLLDKYEDYAAHTGDAADLVLAKRAMGILVGIFTIAGISTSEHLIESHPPIKERIEALLDRINTKDAGRFWEFAAGLLFVMHPNRANIKFQIGPKLRDTVYNLISSFPDTPLNQ